MAATGTRQIEHMGGLARRMPWTAGFFLLGAMAISGLPFLNGFVSEWLVFQSLLLGFHTSSDTFVRLAFPIGGALLGLTTALAAACFVKAFGITFLALPRGEAAAAARESSALMLAPQAALALACVAIGLFPGPVVSVLARLAEGLVGARPGISELRANVVRIAPTPGTFDGLSVPLAALAFAAALGLAAVLATRAAFARRPAPTWGCGGELTAEAEYTATAFSKPLMLIFGAIYRPTREVSTLETTPYYAREVRYRAEVEPTFERFVYRPADPGRPAPGRAHAGDPGGEPPRLPRLRDGARPLPRGAPLVARMSTSLFPLALAFHATGVVARARPAPPPRRVPLGGLPRLGRRVDRHLRPRRVGPRGRPRHPRRAVREPGRRRDDRVRRGPALGLVPRDVRRAGGAGRRLQRGLPGPRDPARPDGVRRRGLERPPDGGRDGVRGRRGPRLPRGLGADEPRHRRARRDRSREPAEPPLRLPLPRHVPPRHGLPRRRLLPPRLRLGLPGLRETSSAAPRRRARGAGSSSSSSWWASA